MYILNNLIIENNASKFTIVDLKKRLGNGELCEFALVESMITEFDFDEEARRVFSFKWLVINPKKISIR